MHSGDNETWTYYNMDIIISNRISQSGDVSVFKVSRRKMFTGFSKVWCQWMNELSNEAPIHTDMCKYTGK